MGWFSWCRNRKSGSLTQRMFRALSELGLTPSHIVDVGGNHGNWTRVALAAFPNAKFTLFEPQRNLALRHTDLATNPRVDLVYRGVVFFFINMPLRSSRMPTRR